MATIPALKKIRSTIKGNITRLLSWANELNADSGESVEAIQTRLTRLKELFNQFNDVEVQIFTCDSTEESDSELTENNFFAASALLNEWIRKRTLSENYVTVPPKLDETGFDISVNNHPTPRVKLPQLELPKFDGDPKKWQGFFDAFCAAIHDKNFIPAAQKFSYLKSCLRGSAATYLQHLNVTEANYKEAFELLIKKYDRKKFTISEFIFTFMNQPFISKASSTAVHSMLDVAQEVVRGLKALGNKAEERDPWLIHILVNKLDSESRSLWAQASTGNDFPSFDNFIEFLEKRCEALDTIQNCYSQRPTTVLSKPQSVKSQSNPNAKSFATSITNVCEFCKINEHKLFECKAFKELSISERRSYINAEKRCYNCLHNNHNVRWCKIKQRCFKCHRKHHSLLHLDDEKPENKTEISEAKPGTSSSSSFATQTASNTFKSVIESQVILPTVVVKVVDNYGGEQNCRALLDSTSMESFITEACVQKLGLPRCNANMLVKGLGEKSVGHSKGKTTIRLIPKNCRKPNIIVNVLILSKLTALLPSQSFKINQDELMNMKLADVNFNQRGPIELLLGTEVFYEILESGKLKLSNNLVLSETSLGWTVAGRMVDNIDDNDEELCNEDDQTQSFVTMCDVDSSLKRFWEIESIETKVKLTDEEQYCEDFFVKTTERHVDGKFIVRLPFKGDVNSLGSTYYVALNRLKTIEKRFSRDPLFKHRYLEFMTEYLNLGHMKEVKSSSINERQYFIPHHGVLKESSTTTKLRVVFDASAFSTNKTSLNSILMVGPIVQSSLVEILMRFRKHRFVIVGDVEKMYRMVWVNNEDAKYQNILWRASVNEPVKQYSLCTVTYGTAPASFISTRCLKELAINNEAAHPQAAKAILNDMYVDDLMTGAGSREALFKLKEDIVKICSAAGFNLRKWCSNDQAVCKSLGIEISNDVKLDESIGAARVLGLNWCPSTDMFKFEVDLKEIKRHTKCSLLSEASKIFDPLGWLAPTIVRVKILFQQLWLHKMEWTDELPVDVLNKWIELRNDLMNLNAIRIPRWVNIDDCDNVDLHGFCDASQFAYSAVVYTRVMHQNGDVSINIISAKTRVAPLKQISIPRLELMGALLLSNLMMSVSKSLSVNVININLWTDSKIVLDWLSDHPRRWPTFVANRTSLIVENYNRDHWRHVPTNWNPADCASRGISASELNVASLWWNGPPWLEKDESEWPAKTIYVAEEEKEIKIVESLATISEPNESVISRIISRSNSFERMKRILVVVIRVKNKFISKIRKYECNNGVLNSDELRVSSNKIIMFVQHQHFAAEIKALSTKMPVHRQSQLKSLNPFIDSDGIMCVGGRISKSIVSNVTKHPIILPRSSKVSTAIVYDYHYRYFHPGVSLMMSLLRQRYWIIRMKDLVRIIIHKCINCIRYKPNLEQPLMGELPVSRVTYDHPFLNVGVDYAGPFRVQIVRKRGQVPRKAYICLFVCLSTKAVHIECAMELTTASFLGAFYRFVSRRGLCKQLYSDNGTNFVGANRHLRELYEFLKLNYNEIFSSLSRDEIVWNFNPPSAPHMGGLWEAAVKSTKAHLKKVVGESILTLEEFCTLITQIEGILNSRPICALDNDELDALTPAHFLIHRPLTIVPEINEYTGSIGARWTLVKKMVLHFWRRWHNDYLTSLQVRTKWKQHSANLEVNDVVLIREDNLPPTSWSMGRVIKVNPGDDGIVRVATIKTAKNELQRPVRKLVKLPIVE